jgi:hypothetical protein
LISISSSASLDELDHALARLNAQYLAYKRATWAPEACLPADFTATPELHLRLLEPDGKRIYFIRCVLETSGAPGIEILKLHVPVFPALTPPLS